MDDFSYDNLSDIAVLKKCWIDTVNDDNRAQGSGNTNKKQRVSRALSWYERSEFSPISDDRIIFSWIAFNALYIQQPPNEPERTYNFDSEIREAFLKKIEASEYKNYFFDFALDNIEKLKKIICFKYLDRKLWKGEDVIPDEKKKKDSEQTLKQLKRKEIKPLKLATENIYVLRNQLMHGMASYDSIYNREQVNLCADFLHGLTGRMIKVVIMDKNNDWGEVPCPPQGTPGKSADKLELLED